MRDLYYFALAEPDLAGMGLFFTATLYLFLYTFVDGSSRHGPGAQRISRLKLPLRVCAYTVFAIISGSIASAALYVYALYPGTLSDVYRVDDRYVALFERTSRGKTDCVVRSTDAATGKVQGISVLRASCDLKGMHARRGWLGTPSRVASMEPPRWYAIDLYTAEVTADASAVLDRYGERTGAGNHRFVASNHPGSIKAELQSGADVWVNSSGLVSDSPEKPKPPVAERLRRTEHTVDRPGLLRARRLKTKCGCAADAEECGELLVFSSTAFGTSVESIGLWHDGKLVWQRALEQAEVASVAAQGPHCVLVTTSRLQVPIIGAQSGAEAMVFERSSGSVSRLVRL
ncbi:MAG: hypothetical protein AAF658_17550 [Myxococcota bacterium]